MDLSDEIYLLIEVAVALAFTSWRVIAWKSNAFFATSAVGWLFVASVLIVLIGNADNPRGRFWITVTVLFFLLLSMFARVSVHENCVAVRGWFSRRRFLREDIDQLETKPSWPDEYGESNQHLWLTLRDRSQIDITYYRPIRELVSALAQPVRYENYRYERMLRKMDIGQWICRVAVALSFVALVLKLAKTYIVEPLLRGSVI